MLMYVLLHESYVLFMYFSVIISKLVDDHDRYSCNQNEILSLCTGRSALHWAAATNNRPALEFLLSKGANKDLQDNQVCLSFSFYFTSKSLHNISHLCQSEFHPLFVHR